MGSGDGEGGDSCGGGGVPALGRGGARQSGVTNDTGVAMGDGADSESSGDATDADDDDNDDAAAGEGHGGDDSDVTPEEVLRLEHAVVIKAALLRHQPAASYAATTRAGQPEASSSGSREAKARTSLATALATVSRGGGSGQRCHGGGGGVDAAAVVPGTSAPVAAAGDVLAAFVADAVADATSCVEGTDAADDALFLAARARRASSLVASTAQGLS